MQKQDAKQYSNKHIAHLLKSVAAAYLLKNENRFKIIAYEKATDTIAHLSREIKDIWKEGQLTQIPGIGSSIGAHISEYLETGRSKHFDQVMKGIPETVFILMNVPTVGPKRAFKLVQALKLVDKDTTIQDLKKAALKNKIAAIPTFGKKSQTEILEAVKTYEQKNIKEERMPLPYAYELANEMVQYLKNNPKVTRIDILGSLRRMTSTIGDIDLAVTTQGNDAVSVIDYFINYPKKISVENAGEKKASIIVHPYIKIDLRAQDKETYGSMLQYFTGSKSHNIKLREYALKKGYSLSEYGINKIKNQKSNSKNTNKKSEIKKFKDEGSFYEFLGLQYIPPEIREGTNEIDFAAKHALAKLVELKDIKGDFHTHSNYDLKPSHDLGVDSYFTMYQKAKDLGYKYIGFSEHNPSISNNSESTIINIIKTRKAYIDEIFSLNKIERSNYFIGLEVDILSDGKIALPSEAIKYVDYLIVSIHSSFKRDIKAMTQRVLSALKYPKVKVLGHPTGRLLLKREGYELEWEKIFEACKKNNIAIEVNAWPERLDLPDILVREAIKSGVKTIINTDSHAASQMENMFYGVSVGRRGWAKKSDIINTLSLEEIKKWMEG